MDQSKVKFCSICGSRLKKASDFKGRFLTLFEIKVCSKCKIEWNLGRYGLKFGNKLLRDDSVYFSNKLERGG